MILAIPTERRGDYLDFWSFVRYTGQETPQYGVKFVWRPEFLDQIKFKLARAKLDYYNDIDSYMDSKRVIAYENPYRKRQMLSEMRKMITEIMNERYDYEY